MVSLSFLGSSGWEIGMFPRIELHKIVPSISRVAALANGMQTVTHQNQNPTENLLTYHVVLRAAAEYIKERGEAAHSQTLE